MSEAVRRAAKVLLALVLLAVCASGFAFWQQGYRVYVVHTGSMVPTYDPGDVVIDAPASGAYHRGQVLTFRHSDLTSDVVTHRVTQVTSAGLIHTKGDANQTADVWQIRPGQVVGRSLGKVGHLGYLLVYLRQPAGIASLATTVAAILFLWGLFFPPVASVAPMNEVPLRPRPYRPDMSIGLVPDVGVTVALGVRPSPVRTNRPQPGPARRRPRPTGLSPLAAFAAADAVRYTAALPVRG